MVAIHKDTLDALTLSNEGAFVVVGRKSGRIVGVCASYEDAEALMIELMVARNREYAITQI